MTAPTELQVCVCVCVCVCVRACVCVLSLSLFVLALQYAIGPQKHSISHTLPLFYARFQTNIKVSDIFFTPYLCARACVRACVNVQVKEAAGEFSLANATLLEMVSRQKTLSHCPLHSAFLNSVLASTAPVLYVLLLPHSQFRAS